MGPDVSLSYSSSTVDGLLGDVQAPWVGVGWNMDSIEIVRKITTDENGYGYVNDFALTLNGTLYQLQVDSNNPRRYYTDHDAFLYIERHNASASFSEGKGKSPNNTTGEWWEVYTNDGTRYQLGYNNDSEQLALMYGYKCTTGGESCNTPDGAYATLGYAGNEENLVAMRWRVDRITDTYGNYIEYKYKKEKPAGGGAIASFDRASYLDTISYTGNDGSGGGTALAPQYFVRFITSDRAIGDKPATYNMWDNVETQLLSEVQVCYENCTAPVRKYQFGYSLETAPNANGTLTLTSVKIIGKDGTEAPTIRFTYVNMDNRAVTGNDEKYPYPRLYTIENGAGGKLIYTYENDGRGTNSWYNYRVQQADVQSGIGSAARQSYTYTDAVYSGGGTLGSLTGYTTTTENQLDYANGNALILSTRHTFGTIGLDIGRELKTEWLDPAGMVLRKSASIYVTDNSGAPYVGWNFRYLYSTADYELDSGHLMQKSGAAYFHNPMDGNLLLQTDYLGSMNMRRRI
jgi:hypothetical protein